MLATLEPYNNFGEMSFFHPAPHSASVRAQTQVKLLYIERSKYDQLLTEEPACCSKLAMNTVASLADRLRRMDEWVDELLSKSAVSHACPSGIDSAPRCSTGGRCRSSASDRRAGCVSFRAV